MGKTHNTINNPSVSVLLDQPIGPVPGGRMQIWHWLSSFQLWPEILPDLQAAKQLDEGELGRGSKLQLRWNSGIETWEISHWHPGQQLDLLRCTPGFRLGWRLSIKDTDSADHYVLGSALQLQFRSIGLILAPARCWFENRRQRQRTRALFTGLEQLQLQAQIQATGYDI